MCCRPDHICRGCCTDQDSSVPGPLNRAKEQWAFFGRQVNAFNDLQSILQVKLKFLPDADSVATAVGCFRYQAVFSGGWKTGLICLSLYQLSLKMTLGRSSSRRLPFPQSSACLQWWTEGPACCWLGCEPELRWRFVCLGFRYQWAFRSALSVDVSEVDS